LHEVVKQGQARSEEKIRRINTLYTYPKSFSTSQPCSYENEGVFIERRGVLHSALPSSWVYSNDVSSWPTTTSCHSPIQLHQCCLARFVEMC